jgi:cytochrome c biogenesis protein CcdA
MQDKLVKTRNKPWKYYFRKLGFCFGIFLGASVIVAIPLSIAATLRANAEEEAKTNDNNEEKTASSEKYNDLLKF